MKIVILEADTPQILERMVNDKIRLDLSNNKIIDVQVLHQNQTNPYSKHFYTAVIKYK